MAYKDKHLRGAITLVSQGSGRVPNRKSTVNIQYLASLQCVSDNLSVFNWYLVLTHVIYVVVFYAVTAYFSRRDLVWPRTRHITQPILRLFLTYLSNNCILPPVIESVGKRGISVHIPS